MLGANTLFAALSGVRAPFIPPVLDLIATAPVGAYSLRRVRSAYSGPAIRVRRSSDSTEQDIGFVGNVLDVAALLAFVGAGDGFITTWYDQSGNGRHLVQATAANQPPVALSGAYLGDIRIAAGSNQALARTDAAFGLIDATATISSVLGTTSVGGATVGVIWSVGIGSGARLPLGVNAGTRDLILRPAGVNILASPTQTLAANGAVITLTKTATADASACSTRLNGSSASSFSASAITPGATDFNIGRPGVNDNGGHGHEELIIWNAVLSGTDLQTLERNQGAAWGVVVA